MEKYIPITGLFLYIIIIIVNLIYYFKNVNNHKTLFIFATIIPGINLSLLIGLGIYHWNERLVFKKMQEKNRPSTE